jgi:diacylglycerol kinase (ATP)
MMEKEGLKGLTRLAAAWRNSLRGLKDIWQSEEAFRLESMALLAALPIAAIICVSLVHYGFLIFSILFLIIVEILNTAIEATIDRIGPERHELSRMAKDLGSLAVLCAALIPLAIWGVSVVQFLTRLLT